MGKLIELNSFSNNKNKLANKLQAALDQRNKTLTNKLMKLIYPEDYNSDYVEVLFAYNEEDNIKASDFIRYKTFYPRAKFASLFCFEEHVVRTLCRTKFSDFIKSMA